MHYGRVRYGATVLGLPKFALVAAGAPGFMMAGLQLFQWAIRVLVSPDAYTPTFSSKQESLSLLMISRGPSKQGPRGVVLPRFRYTWVAFSAEQGQYCGICLW